MPSTPGKTALFGGSFDPPHLGHLEVADAARQRCALDRVIFLPCSRSPHKEQETGATGVQRVEMLRLLTEGLGWAEVSDFEVSRPAPSYSWITVDYFTERLGKLAEIYWILGADQWAKISAWRNSDQLAQKLHFIVSTRGDGGVMRRQGFRSTPVSVSHPASSTALRAAFAGGEPLPQGWLPESIQAYIQSHQLYESAVR